MFHQYCATFTFLPLKNITKYLFIMQLMLIPFSFTFKSPALHKYASVSSLSKSSKFLILQFLVKCCNLHSVFKVLSKSHLLDIFLISSVYYKFSFEVFILSKSLNSPNLHISWANMWYPDYQNKNSPCTESLVSRFSFMHQINHFSPW